MVFPMWGQVGGASPNPDDEMAAASDPHFSCRMFAPEKSYLTPARLMPPRPLVLLRQEKSKLECGLGIVSPQNMKASNLVHTVAALSML